MVRDVGPQFSGGIVCAPSAGRSIPVRTRTQEKERREDTNQGFEESVISETESIDVTRSSQALHTHLPTKVLAKTHIARWTDGIDQRSGIKAC